MLSDRLIVKAQVDETDIGRVRIGQAAIISLDAYPQVKVKAKVDHISYESKIANNVIIYEVDILPEKVPEFFRSGMSANVDIVEISKENVLLIPIEAVKREKAGNYVLLSKGNDEEPVKRPVELGISDERRVEVISGIGAKDKILIVTRKYSPSQDTESGRNPFSPFGRRR